MEFLLVEDHALVREGIRMMLDGSKLVDRTIECPSLVVALHEARARAEHIGLVLLDLGLPDANGLEALDRIREVLPQVPILIVSGGDDPATIQAAFERGAKGYLPKGSSGTALRLALEMVLGGELYVPPHVLSSFSGSAPRSEEPREEPRPATRLTPRQADVLLLLAKGHANKEIAEVLKMSPSTVRVHVSAILERLGVENRTQAATSPTAQVLLAGRAVSAESRLAGERDH